MKKSIKAEMPTAQKTVTLTPVVLEQIKKISEELKVRQTAAREVSVNLELIISTVLSQSGFDLTKVVNLSVDDQSSVLQFELKEDDQS